MSVRHRTVLALPTWSRTCLSVVSLTVGQGIDEG
jgi:hypothetical protein